MREARISDRDVARLRTAATDDIGVAVWLDAHLAPGGSQMVALPVAGVAAALRPTGLDSSFATQASDCLAVWRTYHRLLPDAVRRLLQTTLEAHAAEWRARVGAATVHAAMYTLLHRTMRTSGPHVEMDALDLAVGRGDHIPDATRQALALLDCEPDVELLCWLPVRESLRAAAAVAVTPGTQLGVHGLSATSLPRSLATLLRRRGVAITAARAAEPTLETAVSLATAGQMTLASAYTAARRLEALAR